MSISWHRLRDLNKGSGFVYPVRMNARDRLRRHLENEWKQMMRFAVAGGMSFGVKFSTYWLLSRVMWPTGHRVLLNALAIGVAIIFNYCLHRLWTFRRDAVLLSGSFFRYLTVVVVASGMDTGLFYLLHIQRQFYELASFMVATVLTACFTFVTHRFFTFRYHKHDHSMPPADVVHSA